MTRRPAIVVAALVAVSPILMGCGGSTKAAQPLPKAPTLTVPGDKAAPSITRTSTSSTTNTTSATTTATATAPTTTTQSNPSTPQGGAAPPQTGGAPAGGTTTSSQPAAGTPAQRFEQFCKDNPGAC